MTTLGDIARANGIKRPEPTMCATDLIRDTFRSNPGKRLHVGDVAAIVCSKDPGIDPKYVRSATPKLATEKGKYFLATCGRGYYKLSEKNEKAIQQVTLVVSPNVNHIELFRKAREAAEKRLLELQELRAQINTRYANELNPVNKEIVDLKKELGIN